MLRFALPDDASALRSIYAPYVEQTTVTFEYTVPTQAEFRRRIEETADRWPWIVAVHAGEILGYAYAHPYGEREAYQWSAETSIYLKQEVHGLGVGRKLYTALFALLRLQGCCDAWAVIASTNKASDAFHAALGFTPCGTVPHIGYKMGQWLGVSTWRHIITPGDGAPAQIIPVSALDRDTVQKILRENA